MQHLFVTTEGTKNWQLYCGKRHHGLNVFELISIASISLHKKSMKMTRENKNH